MNTERRRMVAFAILAGVVLERAWAAQPGGSAQNQAPEMPSGSAFLIGVLGALLGYICLYRDTRLADFIKAPRAQWKTLLFDLVVYLLGGGLVTAFMVNPHTLKEAFTGGLAWQGLAGGATAGSELATYKKAAGQ